MAIHLVSVNVRRMKDRGLAACVLRELMNIDADVTAVQETHFVFGTDGQVIEKNFVVLSSFGDRYSNGISLLIECSLEVEITARQNMINQSRKEACSTQRQESKTGQ